MTVYTLFFTDSINVKQRCYNHLLHRLVYALADASSVGYLLGGDWSSRTFH